MQGTMGQTQSRLKGPNTTDADVNLTFPEVSSEQDRRALQAHRPLGDRVSQIQHGYDKLNNNGLQSTTFLSSDRGACFRHPLLYAFDLHEASQRATSHHSQNLHRGPTPRPHPAAALRREHYARIRQSPGEIRLEEQSLVSQIQIDSDYNVHLRVGQSKIDAFMKAGGERAATYVEGAANVMVSAEDNLAAAETLKAEHELRSSCYRRPIPLPDGKKHSAKGFGFAAHQVLYTQGILEKHDINRFFRGIFRVFIYFGNGDYESNEQRKDAIDKARLEELTKG
ncbi:uncharacterized protein B0T15DRAFT_513922 [Chaetomium strumarium]|uniref:Uncharacterized protein n=1 Tax=Chaetomium strumarium TaxID=1170767 RepID=A0AAJ0GQ01_9PEZI|nr:hypothetical protein B0T15DRAFT_513922 [Chaetomium strumarium]